MRGDGDYVLYWMIANRRSTWNFSLQRAADHARELGKPLLVFEALRSGYRWASQRIHSFVLDGMADNAAALEGSSAGYFPYVEPEPGAGRGLLEALAQRAAVVVTDEFPCFFLPRMVASAGQRLEAEPGVLLEAVDSNGVLPLRATDRLFTRAFSFRGYLQKNLPEHLLEMPEEDPLAAPLVAFPGLPEEITRRWPVWDAQAWREGSRSQGLADLPVSVAVAPVEGVRGGPVAARAAAGSFLIHRLARYGEDRNHPDLDGASGLSPYLHFGHISAHEVLAGLSSAEGWSPARLGADTRGSRSGWWGMSAAAESFLDELITWREVGYNQCWLDPEHDRYESLPAWARKTLEEHEADPREHLYTLEQFEAAETHDPLWNAAQRQLLREGRIHNYLRMLWGKKILHWTRGPREALDILIELNNKYALDGRNPNSYSGIFWCLGRYDRAWGPERPIFGKIRYMTSDSTRRKLRLKAYLDHFS